MGTKTLRVARRGLNMAVLCAAVRQELAMPQSAPIKLTLAGRELDCTEQVAQIRHGATVTVGGLTLVGGVERLPSADDSNFRKSDVIDTAGDAAAGSLISALGKSEAAMSMISVRKEPPKALDSDQLESKLFKTS